MPSVQLEITEESVKEYCRKRCLMVVTGDFYDEMMKRWSAQPEQKTGKWVHGRELSREMIGDAIVSITYD